MINIYPVLYIPSQYSMHCTNAHANNRMTLRDVMPYDMVLPTML